MAVRMCLLFPLALAALLMGLRGVPAQATSPLQNALDRPMMSLERLQVSAKRASVDDPASVRALTDQILAGSPFESAPESLKARLHRAELSFRRGTMAPVRESDLAVKLNEEVRIATSDLPTALPDYMRTSEAQIRTVRAFVRRYVPDLTKKSDGTARPVEQSDGMAPAEMALVTLSLLQQKLLNREYQVPPEEWDRQLAARQQAASSQEWTVSTPLPAPKLEGRTGPVAKLGFSLDLGKEGSAAVARVHSLLNELGFEQ